MKLIISLFAVTLLGQIGPGQYPQNAGSGGSCSTLGGVISGTCAATTFTAPNAANGPVVLDASGNAAFPGNVQIGNSVPIPGSPVGAVNSLSGYYVNGVKLTPAITSAPTGWAYTVTPPNDANFNSDSLLELYDFTTVNAAGTVLYDLSGNGNNGMASNVTFSSSGAAFNGTSSYVSIPPVAGGNNFTVIAVAWGTATSLGSMWSEANTGNGNTLLLLGNWMNDNYFRDAAGVTIRPSYGAGSYGTCCINLPDPVYHAYTMTFNGSAVTAQALDITGTYQSLSASGAAAISTNAASIGARASGGTHDLFWAGSIAYLAVWKGTFTPAQLNRIYAEIVSAMAARNVRLPIMAAPQSAGPVLVRQGAVVSNGLEPNVVYDTACSYVASPCFRIWYHRHPDGELMLTESVDGKTAWSTAHDCAMNVNNPFVTKINGTYYMIQSGTAGGSAITQGLKEYTSGDGLTWTFRSVVLTESSGPDAGGLYNSSILYDPVDGWKMVYECGTALNPTRYVGCAATSPDGLNWTKNTKSPIGGYRNVAWVDGQYGNQPNVLSGPHLLKINGQYWIFGHWGEITGASDIYLSYWGDGTGYAQPLPMTAFLARGTAADESGTMGQVADPSVVEVGGTTYIYYGADNGGDGSGNLWNIKLVTAAMPLSQLVLTAGGATTTTP